MLFLSLENPINVIYGLILMDTAISFSFLQITLLRLLFCYSEPINNVILLNRCYWLGYRLWLCWLCTINSLFYQIGAIDQQESTQFSHELGGGGASLLRFLKVPLCPSQGFSMDQEPNIEACTSLGTKNTDRNSRDWTIITMKRTTFAEL